MKRKHSTSRSKGLSGQWKAVIWLSLLAVILITIHIVVLPRLYTRTPVEPDSTDETVNAIRNHLLPLFADFHIRSSWISLRDDTLYIRIPDRFRFHHFLATLQHHLSSSAFAIKSCQEQRRNRKIVMVLGKQNGPDVQLVFSRSESLSEVAGRVAIIIDDFGYHYDKTIRSFIVFPDAITLSIIPGLRATDRIAREARLAEKEILIHMPMEPMNAKYDDYGYTLSSGLSSGDIRLRIQSACSTIPQAVGANNHQGSKITANKHLMRIILREFKREGLFFIDSRTTTKSVVSRIAGQVEIPWAENNLFLDVKDEIPYIERKMNQLAETAARNGQAIAIGHVRPNTLKVLQKTIPQLKTRGIEFVSVSDLLL